MEEISISCGDDGAAQKTRISPGVVKGVRPLSWEKFWLVIAALFVSTTSVGSALGATIDVNFGVFSFDVLNPASAQSSGQNQFTIYNFTGANNLTPDFPGITDVVFQHPSVDVGTGSINIGDVDSNGGGVQPASLTFLSTDNFTSATFDATLSTLDLQLADGTAIRLLSDQVSGVILPSHGTNLAAGADFALLTVTGTVEAASAPEPGTSRSASGAFLVLIATGLRSKRRLRIYLRR